MVENVMTIEEAKKVLIEFKNKLSEIDKLENSGINVFYATGMHTQEIKHSAFLAWLLNPENPHGLNNKFLQILLEDVYVHKNAEEFKSFLEARDITVETEKVLKGLESRIDIFIESKASKTLVIIENKVFTTTHDNQLARYEKLVEDRTDWKKYFIYLTPKGDLPLENGEERENWSIASYKRIIELLNEILKTLPNSKSYAKLKILLGDYIEMVDKSILNSNKEIENLCKQIRREHKVALEILMNYTDNIKEVAEYCAQWFRQNIPDITFKGGKTTFEFYTQPIKNYFDFNGQDISLMSNSLWKCRCVFGYGENIPICISLQKDVDGEWDSAQKKIIEKFAPEKKVGSKYFTLNKYSVELLSVEDRKQNFENIVSKLNDNLKLFADNLREFESILSGIK